MPAVSIPAGAVAVPAQPDPTIVEIAPEPAGRLSRGARQTVAVGILAVIALVAALYLAHAFFVPLLIGILASYALSPVVDWLEARRVPRAIGAALILVALVGAMSWVAVSLRDESAAMIEKLPEAARKLRQHLVAERASRPTALQNMQEAANEIQAAATDAGTKAGAARAPAVKAGRIQRVAARLRARPIGAADHDRRANSRSYCCSLYFLLASGTHFRRKLVQLVGPSLTRKKDAVRILEEVDVQVQRYLLVMLLSNTLVAVGTWLALTALGVEQAGVWGVAAGVLHFIPYLGPLLLAVVSGVAAFLQFGTPLDALLVAGASLLVAGGIGMLFMTWLQSRFASVNAAVLFIALLFFGWLWGVSGLLLGAPLVAIIKVICDRVESLKPVGELLGR